MRLLEMRLLEIAHTLDTSKLPVGYIVRENMGMESSL